MSNLHAADSAFDRGIVDRRGRGHGGHGGGWDAEWEGERAQSQRNEILTKLKAGIPPSII